MRRHQPMCSHTNCRSLAVARGMCFNHARQNPPPPEEKHEIGYGHLATTITDPELSVAVARELNRLHDNGYKWSELKTAISCGNSRLEGLRKCTSASTQETLDALLALPDTPQGTVTAMVDTEGDAREAIAWINQMIAGGMQKQHLAALLGVSKNAILRWTTRQVKPSPMYVAHVLEVKQARETGTAA